MVYPLRINRRGALQPQCNTPGKPVGLGCVYHFYVDQGGAAGGDGRTPQTPWGDINMAFNEEIYNICRRDCARVYVHVRGAVSHGIGGLEGVAGGWGIADYRLNLIFMPWGSGRVAVGGNPIWEENGFTQVCARCCGVHFVNFDFTQKMLAAIGNTNSAYRAVLNCLNDFDAANHSRGINLTGCTINLSLDESCLTENLHDISLIAYNCEGDMNRATPPELRRIVSIVNTRITVNVSGNLYWTREDGSVYVPPISPKAIQTDACEIIDVDIDFNANGDMWVYQSSVVGHGTSYAMKMIRTHIRADINLAGPQSSFGTFWGCDAAFSEITDSSIVINTRTEARNSGAPGVTALWGSGGTIRNSNFQVTADALFKHSSSGYTRAAWLRRNTTVYDSNFTASYTAHWLYGGSGDVRSFGIYYDGEYSNERLFLYGCNLSASIDFSYETDEDGWFGTYQISCCGLASIFDGKVYVYDSGLSDGNCYVVRPDPDSDPEYEYWVCKPWNEACYGG